MSKTSKSYLRDLRIAFPAYRENEKKCFNEISTEINAYCDEHPECTKADLNHQFGTPQEQIRDYFDSSDPDSYMENMRYTHHIKIAVRAFLLFLCISLIVSISFNIAAYREFKKSLINSEDTIITYD